MTFWPAWTDPLRHPRLLGQVHRILHRPSASSRALNEACIVCRYVWRRLEAQPGFSESVRQGVADMEAGRFVSWESEDDPAVGQVDPE